MMRHTPPLLISLLFMYACSPAGDASRLTDNQPANLDSMEISGPIHHTIYNRVENIFDPDQQEFEAEYFDVSVRFNGEEFAAKLRLRGGVRFCDGFPQFKIKLKNNRKIFGSNTFKIVTHGSYNADAAIPVNAPGCSDQLGTRPAGSNYAGEYRLYQVAQTLLPHHIKTFPLSITYIDAGQNLRETGFAFLVEDDAELENRYGFRKKNLDPINESISWRESDDDSILNALIGDEFFTYLAASYQRIEQSNPGWSKKDISAKLPTTEAIQQSPAFDQMILRAKARVATTRLKIARDQQQFVQETKKEPLIHAALFNILIGNTDWAYFGLNDHSSGLRNFKILSDDDGALIPVPYDFDLAELSQSTGVRAESEYEYWLLRLKTQFDSDQFTASGKTFADKTITFLNDSPDLAANIKSSFDNFLLALSRMP